MPHMHLTPETIFRPSVDPEPGSVFDFSMPNSGLSDQGQYKQLINAELSRQRRLSAHLADSLQISRTKLHRILKQTSPLSDGLRDKIFDELDIDHVRAKISVVLLRDHKTYEKKAVFLATESLKSFYFEVMTCRRGSIEVNLRPAIVHEAARRAYDLLLSHQERVMQNDQTLQA